MEKNDNAKKKLETVYIRFSHSFVRDAERRTGSLHLAEDCVHEIFLYLINHPEKVNMLTEEELKRYIIGAIHISSGRFKWRSMRDLSELPEIPGGEDPLEEMMKKIYREEIIQSIEKLPERMRIAVVMRCVYECGYNQIAATLQCSEESARQLVARGRKRLREYRKNNG